MRAALIAGFLLIALAGKSIAAEIELIRVWPGWREADTFEWIGDLFGRTRNEARGKQIVLRTDESTRAGFYFLVRLKSAAVVDAAKFELSVIRPGTLKPATYEFPVTLRPGVTVYHLGLTGPAWPEGKKAHPVAWRFALVAADGKLLAEQKSVLWEMPASK